MAKRIAVGDIVEIPVSGGLAYAQVTHRHAQYGPLLRVLETLYQTRPASLESVAQDAARFVTFLALRNALTAGTVDIVGTAPIPPAAAAFPLFRTGIVDPAIGRVRLWWLWDGEKEWRVGDIDESQRALPIRGIVNAKALTDRIESNWRPQTDRW